MRLLTLVLLALCLAVIATSRRVSAHLSIKQAFSHLQIPKDIQAKLMFKLMSDPQVLNAYFTAPNSEASQLLVRRKMITAIKSDPAIIKRMADEVFGKDVNFTDDQKITLMKIFLDRPEMMRQGKGKTH